MNSYKLEHIINEKYTTEKDLIFTNEYTGLLNYVKQHSKYSIRKLNFKVNENIDCINGYEYKSQINKFKLVITDDGENGSIYSSEVNYYNGVRPAIWVKYK